MTRASLLIAATALAIASVGSHVAEAKPPNVLFIISDDLNCQIGCYGNPVVKTPNIDRLAQKGVRFDRAYCNYPVCNASRTSFLSGRYPDTTKVFGNGTPPRTALGESFRFLPEYFHDHGYFTAGVGKVAHGAFAKTVSYDVFAEPAFGPGENDEAPVLGEARKKKGGAAKKGARKKAVAGDPVPFPWQATDTQDEEEPDGITARRIAELMEEHQDRPFFLAAGFHKPHVPHTAPKKYFDLYPPASMPLAAQPEGDAAGIPAIARPSHFYPDLPESQQRQVIAHYSAATTFMDAQVGVLLDTLDRLRLWDDTIVVFLGDHGWHHGEHGGFWAKVSLMKESARAPLIIAAPGKVSGRACERLAEFIDLYPTLADLCRLPAPEGVEGISLAPWLADPDRPGQKAVFTVVSRPGGLGRALQTEAYTYIEWPDGSAQLYDHARDPNESHNLADDPQHAATLAEMKQLLKGGWKAARSSAAN